MSSNDRLTRPKLERTGPIRSFSTVFTAPGEQTPSGERGPDRGFRDAVSRSVELGYRVIDEYIRQGQRVAETISRRSSPPEAATPDFQALGGNLARYTSEIMAVWLGMADAAMRGTGTYAAAPPPSTAGDTPGPDAADDGIQPAVRVTVESSRATEVSVTLRRNAAGRTLAVHALRAADPDAPRLTDVTVVAGSRDEPVTVRIRVPADHPSGTYTGLIVDDRNSEPCGTVTVRVPSAGEGV